MISGRGKRDQKKGCVSEIHGRRASGTRSVHGVFPCMVYSWHTTTASELSYCVRQSMEAYSTVLNCASCFLFDMFEACIAVLASSLHGKRMFLWSIALPGLSASCLWYLSLFILLVLLSTVASSHATLLYVTAACCPHPPALITVGPFTPSSVRRSCTLRCFSVFSGSPGGHPEGGKGHLYVSPHVILPCHVLRLLHCALGAPLTKYFITGPLGNGAVCCGTLKNVTFFCARRLSLLAPAVSVVEALRVCGGCWSALSRAFRLSLACSFDVFLWLGKSILGREATGHLVSMFMGRRHNHCASAWAECRNGGIALRSVDT